MTRERVRKGIWPHQPFEVFCPDNDNYRLGQRASSAGRLVDGVMITPHATSARPLPFLAESRTRFFRQMRDRFLLRGHSGFLDVRFRGGSLFLACHILGVPLLMGQNPGLQARFGNLDRPSRFLCPPAAQVLRPRRLASRQGSMTPRSGWFVPCDEFLRLLCHFKKILIDVHATSSRARRRPRLLGTKGHVGQKGFWERTGAELYKGLGSLLGDFLKQRLCLLFHSPLNPQQKWSAISRQAKAEEEIGTPEGSEEPAGDHSKEAIEDHSKVRQKIKEKFSSPKQLP